MMDINELLFLGTNKYGQAGIGEKYHNKTFTQPKSFAFPIFIKQISCGSHHSALLTIDGNVYTMGSNIHGALGSNPTLNYSFTPTLVQGINEVTKINCGPFHMCAISDGALYSWGKGIDGQLGHGNTKNMPKPTYVQSLAHNVEDVSCGTNHTIVSVRDEDQISCFAFGNGIYGQLGTGQSRNSYAPVRIKLENIDSFAAGDNHSLFIVGGKIYACGDNSNGQLGTLFNKKFSSQPTKIQLQNDDPFVSVFAKKYSMALTEKGQMYIWGLKAGFGKPKKLKSSEQCNLEIIQARIGTQKCFSLESKGGLYQWNIMKGQQLEETWLCATEKVVFNNRAILDFSVGEGYLLILGDIVKQIQYNTNPAPNLSCFEDLQSNQNSFRFDQSSLSRDKQSNNIFQSQVVQENVSRESYEYIKPQSHIEEKNHNHPQYDGHLNSERENLKNTVESQGLREKRDFNNLVNLREQRQKKDKIKVFTSSPVPQPQPLHSQHIEHDTFELMQSQSSSIQCQPTNFLKESLRIQPQHILHQDSILQQSSQQIEYPQHFLKQKKKQDFLEDKENMMLANFQKKGKSRKIDRVMEMLQKSHSISSKTIIEKDLQSEYSQSTLNESEIIKTNRQLRVDIREKQLKISQLQELLSRKEMEIEAQREVIKLLRQKNSSGFASIEKN